MQQTEKIRLDMDLIPEELYTEILKAFFSCRDDVISVDDIDLIATVTFDE